MRRPASGANLLTGERSYLELHDQAVARLPGQFRQLRQIVSVNPSPTPHVLRLVFDLFIQADRSLERRQGGLGIGLTLVRRLADLHGGRVEAASAAAGQGSVFTIRLPRLLAGGTEPEDPRTLDDLLTSLH